MIVRINEMIHLSSNISFNLQLLSVAYFARDRVLFEEISNQDVFDFRLLALESASRMHHSRVEVGMRMHRREMAALVAHTSLDIVRSQIQCLYSVRHYNTSVKFFGSLFFRFD